MISIPLLLAAVVATNSFNKIENPARITSDTTYYDRKEGIVVFKGHVHVDDKDYQMHADRAYLFLSETNSLDRIAATGAIALTNGTKRAYGGKLTYRRDNGLVVLHGSDGAPAMVLDETPDGQRTLRGRKILLWINSEQVEVVEADISAPTAGAQDAIPGFGSGR